MKPPPEVDAELAYFRDIERAFVERRGDPLFISNADWVFLAGLRKKSVPIRIVLRGIADAFDAHRHSFSRSQKIRSLRFCQPLIEAAVTRHKRALNTEGVSKRRASDAIDRLRGVIADAAVRQPTILKPTQDVDLELGRISKAYAAEPEFDLDAALAHAEDRLADALVALTAPSEIAEIAAETRRATASFETRMPPKVYETLIRESTRRKILQRHSIPRLQLSETE